MNATAPTLSPFALSLDADGDAAAAIELRRIHETAPYGHAIVSRSIIADQPRSVSRVVIVAIYGDTLTYTTDGVWMTNTRPSAFADWRIEHKAQPSAAVPRALRLVREFEAARDEWLADVDREAARGNRPSHCFHGSSLWVDYDVACGPCEDPNDLGPDAARADVIVWALAESHREINWQRRARALRRRLAHTMILFCLEQLRIIGNIPESERSPSQVRVTAAARDAIATERAKY